MTRFVSNDKKKKNSPKQLVPISVRCFADIPHARPASGFSNDNSNSSVVLSISIEKTNDKNQNLTFGSTAIWINDVLYKICLFYDDSSLKKERISMMQKHATVLQEQYNCDVTVLPKTEFATRVFFPYVYEARARLVGFDLPYVLSRIVTSWTGARKVRDAFSLKLVEDNPRLPAVRIKSISSNAAFIQFAAPIRKKSEKKNIPTRMVYRGNFVDVKTISYAMTNDSFDSVYDVAERLGFDCSRNSHKKVTPKAIDDSVQKTILTYDLYSHMAKTLQDTFLVRPAGVNRLYSPATLAKLCLKKFKIRPFLEKNDKFPKEVLGHLLGCYFGGRVEVRIRKQPTRVTYLDLTSTYPSLFCLMNMYQFLIAEKIETAHTKKETQELLDKITLDDISKEETWKGLVTICKVKPDGRMILPVRSAYEHSRKTQNIGVNYLETTDGTCMWFTIHDVIASKLLTGTTPTIEDAITFVPVGMQEDLPDEDIEIFKGVTINPRHGNFIQKLIEKRLEIKEAQADNSELDGTIQNTIKIIANTASYGIHIQINSEKTEKKDGHIAVYGIDDKPFLVDCTTLARREVPARHFNPILGVFMPAASRLVLAAAECIATKHRDGYAAYMDTDAIFVSPRHADEIQEFFQGLNPYDKDVTMFKIEKDDNGKPLENVLFYGISSKRYALYDNDEDAKQITIRKHTLHGLGHLIGIDSERLWEDILRMYYFPDRNEEILSEYDKRYCLSKMGITTPEILARLSKNDENARPFDRLLLGAGYKTDEKGNTIIPTLPFAEDRQGKDVIQYMPFSCYMTGKKYPNKNSEDTSFYWKPLSGFVEDYANNREVKLSGDVGFLKRLHIKADRNSIQLIGKETPNIDETNAVGVGSSDDSQYVTYDNITKKILCIRPKDAWKVGISRSNLLCMQKKIRENGIAKLHKKTIERISAFIIEKEVM